MKFYKMFKRFYFNINKISISRQFLMGIAILWIVLFHSFVGTDIRLSYPLYLKYIIVNGSCGVDIFVFLSGFGIFCSLHNNPNEINFYKKRILRLLPIFPLVIVDILIFYIAYKHITFVQIFGYILQVNFWIYPIESYKLYFWYISFIIVCYFISPIFYNIIVRLQGNLKYLSFFIGFLFLLTIPFHNLYSVTAICRFPIYFLE